MQPLTDEEIHAIYTELETLKVELKDQPEVGGLQYITERLTLCRAMQDRVNELRLRIGRAFSWVQTQQIYLRNLQELQPSAETKKQLRELDVLLRSHAMVFKLTGACGLALSRTAMDIRLLAQVTQQRLKLGEIDPKGAPKDQPLVQPVDLRLVEIPEAQRIPVEPVPPPPPTPAPPDPEPPRQESPVAEIVSFDETPAGVPVEPDRIVVPETQATPIEILFQELTHGNATHPDSPF